MYEPPGKFASEISQTSDRKMDISAKNHALLDTVKEEPGLYEEILRDYFQLNVSLVKLYQQWGKVDENFKEVASEFPGIRILRQDPTETLFSFICSSNNHISRISGMIERMCETFGNPL